MEIENTSRYLRFIQNLIFYRIGDKLKPGSLRTLNDYFFRIIEKIIINFRIYINNYINIYNELIEEEIKFVNITQDDNILVIGCGSIPSTCILLSGKTNAKVTGVDIDRKAIKNSINLIKKLKLEDKIKIVHFDDLKYQVKDYSIILVLFGVKNLNKLFMYLSENVKDTTKIILRSPFFFDDLDNNYLNLKNYFYLDKKLLSKSFGNLNILLLKKIK
jgi:hypothetical protein